LDVSATWGAPDCSGGERACITFHMCDNVHAQLGTPVVGYANIALALEDKVIIPLIMFSHK